MTYEEFVPRLLNTPRTHQLEAFDFAFPRTFTLLAIEMGAGKTFTTIALAKAWEAKNILVVCPCHVIPVWAAEFKKHDPSPPRILMLGVEQAKGSLTKRTDQARKCRMVNEKGKGSVLVINYESVWRKPFSDFLKSQPWDLIVCDESQRIKGHDSKVSRFMAELTRRSRRRLELTGTPLYHSQLDIWAQARFLDPALFGWSYHRFEGRYAKYRSHMIVSRKNGKPMMEDEKPMMKDGKPMMKDGKPVMEDRKPVMKEIQIVCGYRNEEELKEKMREFSFRPEYVDKSTWPEFRHETFTHDLGEAARGMYQELKTEMSILISEGIVTVFNGLKATLRLRQLCSGHTKADGKDTEVVEVHREKEKLLREILTDVDSPVTVFTNFRHDYIQIRRAAESLGRRYGEVSGTQHDLGPGGTYPENTDVLSVNYRSGGSGVNLQNLCHHAIYYTPTYSAGDYAQSLRRVWRDGQKNAVVFTHLLAKDTIEEVVFKALMERNEVNTAMIEALA